MNLPGLPQVRQWLAQAQHIAVLSGAGISAESGVPTFRDAQTGLWARFRPEDLATEDAFRVNPKLVWDWYAMRRDMLRPARPNAGHLALAAFAARHPDKLTLITQNVDGLHERAGSPAVLPLHGNIYQDQWLSAPQPCCDPDWTEAGSPPHCAGCGNLLRPAVVWFGEALPLAALEAAQKAARTCGVMLVVGTSGVVYPAAGLARSAQQAGAKVVVVNTAPTALDEIADALLCGPAAEILPTLLEDL